MDKLGDLIPAIPGELVTVPDLTFTRFWSEYPRKTGDKAKAKAKFEALSTADRVACIDGAIHHREGNPQWQDKSLIPHPMTFINQRRWENEFTHAPKDEVQANQDKSPADMVWSAFMQAFGNRFLNEYGDKPNPVWIRGLSIYSPGEILKGVKHVVDSGMDHPPSLSAFKKFCRSDAVMPETRMLPKAPRNDEAAFAAFDQMREMGLIR